MIGSKGSREQVLQVKCLIGDEGHVWIGSYDTLPPPVRQRLRDSPFNLCAACLVMFVLPKVQRRHPSYSRNKALFAGIEMMEAEVRKEERTSDHPIIRGGVKRASDAKHHSALSACSTSTALPALSACWRSLRLMPCSARTSSSS
jgi:hypothetical protein